MWHVYVVRAADGSLYTGIAKDVDRRMTEHRTRRKGAKYLRGRDPFEVVYRQHVGGHALALEVERRVKRMPKAKKERLLDLQPDVGRLCEMLAIRKDEPT